MTVASCSTHLLITMYVQSVGIEDAMMQLTMQMSRTQQQLDERKRQHATLQFQIQDLTLQEQQPTAAAYTNPPPYLGPSNGSAPLPDFSTLSLEEADWFHEGIPRCVGTSTLLWEELSNLSQDIFK